MILQRGKLGFWEESYINNIFSNSAKREGDYFFGKKKFLLGEKSFQRPKKTLWRKTTARIPNTRKGSFPSFFISIRTNQKEKAKILFFISILLLKHHSSLTRGYSLIFQAKNTIKTVNILWRENQYCINISFLLLSLLFF